VRRTQFALVAGLITAVSLVLLALPGAAAADSGSSYTLSGSPLVDGVVNGPWNTSQGDSSAGSAYQSADLFPTYTPGGNTTTVGGVTEPNLAVYPAQSGNVPYPSGVAGTPGPLDGYCSSLGPNPETGTNVQEPANTDLPMSPYYFPQIVLNQDGSLTGYFDWRPKDADEAIVVARSTDGGKTWTAEGQALEQNQGYCPTADTNDDGEGHPFVADFGGGSALYTLQRAVGDYAGTNLLLNPVNPSAPNPLANDPATSSVGVDPNTFATASTQLSAGSGTAIPVSTLGGDAANGNSTSGLIPIPDPSALPSGNAEYEDISQGHEGSGGTTPPVITCTGTSGTTGNSPALTGCTSPAGITVGASDDLVEVFGIVDGIVDDNSGNPITTIPAGPNNPGGSAGTDLFLAPYTNKTTAKTNLGSLHPSANSNTISYLLNANAPDRYYVDGSTVYCTQGNAEPTQAIETCTTTTPGGITVHPGDPVIADGIIPAAAGGGPVGQTNGLLSPDGIIGSLPASANSAWGQPSNGHVVLYTEKLVNYFIEGGINGTVSGGGASSYSNFKTDTLGTQSSPKSTFATPQTGSSSTLATGFVEAPGSTPTNYNISPFPTESEQLPSSGSFNVYVGGQTATGGADLDTLTCSGWDVNTAIANLYNPNLHTIDLLGCTGGTGGSAGDGFNAGHQGNWVAGPGAAIEFANGGGKSILPQIGEGKALTTGQAQKLFGNNEDYEVVRAAYTTDGANFTDLGPISGSTSGAVAGGSGSAPQTCPTGGAGATTGGYTDISDPCQQDAPSGTGSTPGALDSASPQGDSPASLPAGTADAVELRWPGARGTIITNPDGSIGMFLSGAWASDGDSDAFNQIFYTSSSDGGKTWSVPKVIISTDYSFAASAAQDQAVANGHNPALDASAYYEGRAYDPTVVQNKDGSLTLVFAGYRVPNPVKAAGTPIGTNSSALYCEGVSSNGCTTTATPSITQTDPALYRNILTQTLTSSTTPRVGTSSAVQASENSITYGDSVSFTDTVTVPSPGSGTPTGRVNFSDNGNPIAGCQNVTLSDTGTAQCTPASALPAGQHTITADYSGDSNYAASTGSLDAPVAQATLHLDGQDASTVYGTAPTLTYQLSGFVNGDSQSTANIQGSGSCSVPSGDVNVGTYSGAITCDPGNLSAPNYTFASGKAGTLTITPATLNVDAQDASTVYGTAPTLTYQFSGFVNGDNQSTANISGSGSCSVPSGDVNVGTYSGAITCGPGTLSAPNYTFASGQAGTLTITPATLNVDAQDASTVYGTAPTLTYQLSGFVNGENVSSASVIGIAQCSVAFGDTDAGVYPGAITCTPGSLSAPNYMFAAGRKGTLTITQAPQQITFKSTPPASPRWLGTYVVSATASSGLPVNFTIDGSGTPGACSVSGSTVSFTGTGVCVIDANQMGNRDYQAAQQVQQRLTISPVTAPGGGNCANQALTGTIKGNLTVPAGDSCLLTSNAHVTGSVQLGRGATLIDQGATIDQNLNATDPTAVQIGGSQTSTIGQSVEITGLSGVGPDGSGDNYICNASVGQNLSVQNAAAGASPIVIGDSAPGSDCSAGDTVGQNLQLQGNAAMVDAADNQVGQNLQVTNNTGGVRVDRNQVGQNLQVQNNSAGAEVSGNTVSHNAQCSGNQPAATGSGNHSGKNQGCPS
jgi:hypothetical protein